MLYMVEMDLPDRSREVDWHAWYRTHIGKLLTVDGYHGGQRFESLTPTPSPFLALHDVDDLAVFESDHARNFDGPESGCRRTRLHAAFTLRGARHLVG